MLCGRPDRWLGRYAAKSGSRAGFPVTSPNNALAALFGIHAESP